MSRFDRMKIRTFRDPRCRGSFRSVTDETVSVAISANYRAFANDSIGPERTALHKNEIDVEWNRRKKKRNQRLGKSVSGIKVIVMFIVMRAIFHGSGERAAFLRIFQRLATRLDHFR